MKYFNILTPKERTYPNVSKLITDYDIIFNSIFLKNDLFCDSKTKFYHAHKLLFNVNYPISKALFNSKL